VSGSGDALRDLGDRKPYISARFNLGCELAPEFFNFSILF
jgi:hypothetical protein